MMCVYCRWHTTHDNDTVRRAADQNDTLFREESVSSGALMCVLVVRLCCCCCCLASLCQVSTDRVAAHPTQTRGCSQPARLPTAVSCLVAPHFVCALLTSPSIRFPFCAKHFANHNSMFMLRTFSSAEMHKKRLLACKSIYNSLSSQHSHDTFLPTARMSSGVRIITGTSRDRTPPNCYRWVAAHGVRCAKHRWPPTAARARACTGWELLLINRKSVRSKVAVVSWFFLFYVYIVFPFFFFFLNLFNFIIYITRWKYCLVSPLSLLCVVVRCLVVFFCVSCAISTFDWRSMFSAMSSMKPVVIEHMKQQSLTNIYWERWMILK